MSELRRAFEICRIDEDERRVWGIVSTEMEASDGLVVSRDAIEAAWPDYMKFGNVREMHQDIAAGVVEESSMTESGMMVGVYVADDSTWNKVKRGVLKAFSIRGPILEVVGNVVTKLKLTEISLVDRGADPGALITMFRAEGSEHFTQSGPQPQEESTMSDKGRQALAAQKPGAAVKRDDGGMLSEALGGNPAIEAIETNILAEIGQHVDAIGALVAKFNDLHDNEKVAPEVLAHMQNSHRSMGKAMASHLKASTSYGAKDEPDGDEEAKRSEGIPHKPAGSKLDQVLSRMDDLAKKVEAVSVKRSEGEGGYKPVVIPETPLIAVEKGESVVRAEGSAPVDNDPKEGTPEWNALPELTRFEIADRRNTTKHQNAKA